MTEHRAKPGDLCMSDAMPFQQHFEYRTTLPLADIITPLFFNPVRHSLRVGDDITLVRYNEPAGAHQSAKVLEIANVRVIHKPKDAVHLHLMGDVTVIPGEEADDTGSPKVEWGGPQHKWRIVDADGEVVAKGFEDKDAAESALAAMAEGSEAA